MNYSGTRQELFSALADLKTRYERLLAPLIRAEGLTQQQFMLLCCVGAGQVRTVNGAGRALCIGQGNASTLCKRLEADGFLLRSRSQADERVVTLTLTEQGRAALGRIDQALDRYSQRILSLVSQETLDRFMAGMAALRELPPLMDRLAAMESEIEATANQEKEPVV